MQSLIIVLPASSWWNKTILSLCSRKETYEVDYCYEQNEDTEKIYAKEVKPLISGVFEGHHATVIAYGARGTGKTSTIQVQL